MSAHSAKVAARVKRGLLMSLVAALIAAGLLLYLATHSAPEIEAAPPPVISSVAELAAAASKGIQGHYQQEDVDNLGDYELWRYRTDNSTHTNYKEHNECDAKDDGNETPKEPLIWGDDNFNDVVSYKDQYETKTYTHQGNTYSYQVQVGYEYRVYCGDRNAADFGDNLKYSPSFPTPHHTSAPRSPSAHDWNNTGLEDASDLEDDEPFYVIGTTGDSLGVFPPPPGTGGIRSPVLEMNLWLPKLKNTNILKIVATGLCNTRSDDRDSGRKPSHTTLSIEIDNKNGLQSSSPHECPSNKSNWQLDIPISNLGEPIEERIFIIDRAGTPEEEHYERYQLRVKTRDSPSASTYTNQFRLKIEAPLGGYLGIAKTDLSNVNEPENALAVGMRLPGSAADFGFRRLQIFWEINLYVAVDPEKGCAVNGEHGKFGLYDTDYRSGQYPPSLKIYQSDVSRNEFLDGTSVTKWKEVKGFKFTTNPDNEWSTQIYEEFRGDKIYRFRFYNLGQRSWMQIGIPFEQAHALQKCIDKPLVKVYHGDISVGGHFGNGVTSRACLREDSSLGQNRGNIYAHAIRKGDGDYGSSAEYAVYAREAIVGFYSNYKRAPPAPPNPPNQLTFANADDPWGGEWGEPLRCIPNWWRGAASLAPDTSIISWDLKNAESNKEFFFNPSLGSLTVRATYPALPAPQTFNLKITIYVQGDLTISEDIINENNNLTQFNQINSIYFVVKGDILIEDDAERIDAVLIAVPRHDNTKGRIFTCSTDPTGSSGVDLTDDNLNLHYHPILEKTRVSPPEYIDVEKNKNYNNQCQQKLTVNGALIGRQIRLGRVTNPNLPDGHITEEINLLPEYFVGRPQLPAHTDWFYRSDSITILPVNF